MQSRNELKYSTSIVLKSWFSSKSHRMTWYIRYCSCESLACKKGYRVREREGFWKFTGTNIVLWTICYFLLGTYQWNRSLFMTPAELPWKCTGCGTSDARMNGQVLVWADLEWSRICVSVLQREPSEASSWRPASFMLPSTSAAYYIWVLLWTSRKETILD